MASNKKAVGRPATGKGTPVTVRLDDDLLAAVDAFRLADVRQLTRPQAIRAVMKMMIGSRGADRDRRAQELLERGRRLQAQKSNVVAPQ